MLFSLIWGLQHMVGAYASERGLFSDEAAHLLNGLVLRDYLREGVPQNPLEFARTFYSHYPKIAPFVWPPFFHVALGLAMLPGWPPNATALTLLALCTTWIAYRLFWVAAAFSSRAVAAGTVALMLAAPSVIELTTSVMLDIVIAAAAFEAAWWLGRFAQSGHTRDAVAFGIMTAVACLTKGNGLSVVLAPLVLLALGRTDLLRRPGLYVAGALVLVCAGPLLGLALWLGDPGDFETATPSMMGYRLAFYARYVWSQLGAGATVFAIIGMVAVVTRRPRLAPDHRGLALALVALVGGAVLFHVFNPHVIPDGRYFALALPPLLALAALGAATAAGSVVSRPGPQAALAGTVMALLAAVQLIESRHVTAQPPLGYRAVMTSLVAHNELEGHRVLIVSNEQGEGAGVVEAAILGVRPPPTILRGSKLLASDDWMGRNFRLHYETPDAVLGALEAERVDYVILDGSPEARALKYWPLVHAVVTTRVDRFDAVLQHPVNAAAGPLRPLTVYRSRRRSAD